MAMRRYHDFVLLTDDPELGDDGKLAAFSVRVFQSAAGEGERKERVTIPHYEDLNAQRRRLADRLSAPLNDVIVANARAVADDYARWSGVAPERPC